MHDIKILQFEEKYFSRIWGGRKLDDVYGKKLPVSESIGEAWLISDHPQCESKVINGKYAGKTLRELMEGPEMLSILGSRVKLTPHERFPLLLKLLDAREDLSIQVHPDDEAAFRLGEPDVGKTEMWHVLHSDSESTLICGLKPSTTPESFASAIQYNQVDSIMNRFSAPEDTVVFVPAGTVHALGKGFIIAEIQQNSDLTYRIYDWDRCDAAGNKRELHLDKALQVTSFESHHSGPNMPLTYEVNGYSVAIEAACRYFASELVRGAGTYTRNTRGESFHILLGVDGDHSVKIVSSSVVLKPGEAMLIPGEATQYSLTGQGSFLVFYVPDLMTDVFIPLTNAGHSKEKIIALGGAAAATNDLIGLQMQA